MKRSWKSYLFSFWFFFISIIIFHYIWFVFGLYILYLCYVLNVDDNCCDCDSLSASLCCSSLLCGWVSRNWRRKATQSRWQFPLISSFSFHPSALLSQPLLLCFLLPVAPSMSVLVWGLSLHLQHHHYNMNSSKWNFKISICCIAEVIICTSVNEVYCKLMETQVAPLVL